MARPLAAAFTAVAVPGAHRCHSAASRSSAGQLHLGRHPPPRDARRWSGARLWRMVETRRRTGDCARLFSGRGRGGRALLDLPRWRRRGRRHRFASLVPSRGIRMSAPRYIELQCTSHFSFLRGASSCDELFVQAAKLGIEALAIVDRNSLAGIVRAHEAAKAAGCRLIVGCRLDLTDGMSVLVYPTDRPAYARLCRLLSLGKRRGGKAQCRLDWSDLVAYGEGLIAVLVPDEANEACALRLRRLAQAFGDRAYMALTLRRHPNDALRLHELSNLAAHAGVPTIVTNDVLFHVPARRILQDVVTCIRHNCGIDDAGFRRERHADRY